MPALLTCPCGKQFRAPEDSAGKRIKCPGCGLVSTMPTKAAPAKAPAAPATIAFECDCGHTLRVKAEHAGRKVRCPGCNEPVTIPAAAEDEPEEEAARIQQKPAPARKAPARRQEEDEEEEAPRARRRRDEDEEDEDEDREAIQKERPARRGAAAVARHRRDEEDEDEDRPRGRRDEDEDEEEEEEERPRRRKKAKAQQGSILPWVLLGSLAVVLLGGGGAAAWWFLGRSDKPKDGGPGTTVAGRPDGGDRRQEAPPVDDVALVPPDAELFAVARVAEVLKLGDAQQGLNALRAQPNNPLAQMQNATGLTPADVDRVWGVVQSFQEKEGWFVVRTLKPYDRNLLLSKLQNVREVKHAGKSYHAGRPAAAAAPMPAGPPRPAMPAPRQEELALFFAGPQVLAVSDEKGMKRCLTAVARSGATGPLAAPIQQAAGGRRHLEMGFVLSAYSRQQIQQEGRQIPKPFTGAAALLDCTAGNLALDLGATLQVDANLTYADGGASLKAKKALDGVLAAVQLTFIGPLEEQAKRSPNAAQAQQAVNALKGLLAGVSSEQKGADLQVKVKADLSALRSLVPQGGVPAGPGFNPPRPGVPPRPIMPRGPRP
jgi:hypothetical protein